MRFSPYTVPAVTGPTQNEKRATAQDIITRMIMAMVVMMMMIVTMMVRFVMRNIANYDN